MKAQSGRVWVVLLLVALLVPTIRGVVYGKERLIIFGTARPEIPESNLRELGKRFEAEHPNVEVVWRLEGPWSELLLRLTTARLSGEPIDLIVAPANQVNSSLVRKQLLMDLTEVVPQGVWDRVDPATLGAYTIGGRRWGVPFSYVATAGWYYNEDAFAKAGVHPPKTYDDMVQVAKKLRAVGYVPAIHQGKNAWMWPMWYFETFAQTSRNRSVEYTKMNLTGKRQFTSDADVEALAWIKRFFDDGILTSASMDTDQDAMRAAFVSGKAAMYYGGTWELPWLRDNAKGFKVGVFKFPRLYVDSTVQPPGGPDHSLAISSGIDRSKLALAVEFIEFATRKDNAELWIGPMEPVASAIKDVPGATGGIAEQMRKEFMKDTITYLDWIWPQEINEAMQAAIQAVVTNQKTPREAMQDVQDTFNQLVKRGYRFDYWESWTPADWKKVTP